MGLHLFCIKPYAKRVVPKRLLPMSNPATTEGLHNNLIRTGAISVCTA